MVLIRDVVLNIYIFDSSGKLAAIDRKDDDIFESDVVTTPILILPTGEHPVKYIQKYLESKKIKVLSLDILPAIYLNTFDSEPEKEYLVLSFKISTTEFKTIAGDRENPTFVTMSLENFSKHPKLMPEFKKNNFLSLFSGSSVFYSGHYKDSDKSNQVLNLDVYG
jgi:hypothetical protein